MSFLWHILRLQEAALLRLAASKRSAVEVCTHPAPPVPVPVVVGHPIQGWQQAPRFMCGNTNGTATTALLSKRYPESGSGRLDR